MTIFFNNAYYKLVKTKFWRAGPVLYRASCSARNAVYHGKNAVYWKAATGIFAYTGIVAVLDDPL